MYVASMRSSGSPGRGRIPGTVVALGTVSLLTDISAEMITAFLPLYLLYTVQLSYAQFGLIDGLYTGATTVLRLVGGHLADRLRRPKAVAAAGYTISAVTKLAFPLVGASTAGVGLLVAADRAGKGLRTAPRDALISLATPADRLGAAFGVHRTMDTIGALLGPLVTFLLLSQLGMLAGPIFMISSCFALLGIIVLVTFVRERPLAKAAPAKPASIRAGFGLLTDRRFRGVTIVAAILGLATVSDAFIYVLLQRTTGIPLQALPLLPLSTAAVFLLAATPLGKLSDRVGRWPVFLGGHVLLLVVYVLMLGPGAGYPLAAAALVCHGLFYAATDGVLSATVGGLVPEHLRGSGLAVVQTAQALSRLVSSIGFGFLLYYTSVTTAVVVGITALGVALAVTCRLPGGDARHQS